MAIAMIRGKPLTECALQNSNKREAADATSGKPLTECALQHTNKRQTADATRKALNKTNLPFFHHSEVCT